MSLFSKRYDFRNDFLSAANSKFRHLDRITTQPDKVTVREPRMDGNGTTVVFLPYPDFDNPDYAKKAAVCPDRNDVDDPRSYGPWLFAAEGVRYFGRTPVTMLFDNPDDSGFIPTEHHPVHLVYDAALRAVKSQQLTETPFGSSASDHWDVLLNGKKGPPAVYGCLNRPGPLTVAYALVYTLGKDDFMATGGVPLGGASGDNPVLFVMTRSTCQSLFEALDDQAGNITGTVAVHFYDRKTGHCPAKLAATAAAASSGLGGKRAPLPGHGGGEGSQVMAGYGVYVSPTISGRPDDQKLNRAMFAQHACTTVKPWDKVIRGFTPEQCADIVANQCGLPMSLLYHAWKSMPEYYTEEMRHRLKNPSSVDFGNGRRSAVTEPEYDNSETVTPAAGMDFGVSRQSEKPANSDAPWGGNIYDGADGPGEDATAMFDAKLVEEAEAKLRAHMAAAAKGPEAARSQAGRR